MKVIILGATGMVGSGVLLECLASPDVQQVLTINRKPAQRTHPKLKELVHDNFYDFTSVQQGFSAYDACFFCLGVSVAGLSEAEYRKITYELTMSFAHALLTANPDVVFCYVSGASTDSTEKGRAMWARVKGATENALLRMPFKDAYMFRPGYIQPLKGVRSKTGWYNAFYTVLKPLYFLLKPFKGIVTDTVSLGNAMLYVAQHGFPQKIITSRDINNLAQS